MASVTTPRRPRRSVEQSVKRRRNYFVAPGLLFDTLPQFDAAAMQKATNDATVLALQPVSHAAAVKGPVGC